MMSLTKSELLEWLNNFQDESEEKIYVVYLSTTDGTEEPAVVLENGNQIKPITGCYVGKMENSEQKFLIFKSSKIE